MSAQSDAVVTLESCMRLLPFFSFFTAIVLGFGATSAQAIHLKINAGGDSVDGWESDASFAKGGTDFAFKGKHDVSRATDPAPNQVYETVRHQDHSISFPTVPDGEYVVRIHFTDKFDNRDRRMDYEIEGVVRIDDFCPYMEAGKATSRVVIEEVRVKVEDGNGLQIVARKDQGNDVFHAAIEVISIDDPAVAERAKSLPITASLANASPKVDSTSEAIRAITGGAPARLVWSEMEKNLDDHVARSGSARLLGIDTEDGKGIREILGELSSYAKPMITPDGTRVVYTHGGDEHWYVVNFDGSERRRGARGYASDVWQDPETGIIWVYARNHFVTAAAKIFRHQLDNPEIQELVYDKAPVGHDQVPWFRVSADGKMGGEAFPWPRCGVMDLTAPGGSAPEIKGNGCWTSVAADNSYQFMHFLGNHTEVVLYQPGEKKGRKIKVNTAPPMNGQKVYYPRWGRNDTRFITVSAPQWKPETELYLGRFDAGMTRVEEWVRVTHNGRAEYFGDVWISHEGNAAKTSAPPKPIAPPKVAEGETAADWSWENGLVSNEVEFAEGTRFSPSYGMDLIDGWAIAKNQAGSKLSASIRQSGGFSIELIAESHEQKQSGPARIMGLSASGSSRNFTLVQSSDQFVFRLRTTENGTNGTDEEIKLGEVTPGVPQHLVVSANGGNLNAWIDGEQTVEDVSVGGTLSNWTGDMQLIFGDEVGGSRNWNGAIEGVSIYASAISPEQVGSLTDQAEERLSQREEVKTIVVKARVKEVSRPFGPGETDYPRSLTADLWEVTSVEEGKLSESEIIVTRWVMLGRKPVRDIELEVGDTAELVIESHDGHPELDGEHLSDDLSVFDAPRYHLLESN